MTSPGEAMDVKKKRFPMRGKDKKFANREKIGLLIAKWSVREVRTFLMLKIPNFNFGHLSTCSVAFSCCT